MNTTCQAFEILAKSECDMGLMSLAAAHAACHKASEPQSIGDYMAWIAHKLAEMIAAAGILPEDGNGEPCAACLAADIAYMQAVICALEKLGFQANPLPMNSSILDNMVNGPNGEQLVFEFHRDDADGRIMIEPSGPGLAIWAPDVSVEAPIAIVDLWHSSPDGLTEEPELDAVARLGEGKSKIMLVIQDPRSEDPLAYVHYWPERTLIEYELGTGRLGTSENGSPIMGLA